MVYILTFLLRKRIGSDLQDSQRSSPQAARRQNSWRSVNHLGTARSCVVRAKNIAKARREDHDLTFCFKLNPGTPTQGPPL